MQNQVIGKTNTHQNIDKNLPKSSLRAKVAGVF